MPHFQRRVEGIERSHQLMRTSTQAAGREGEREGGRERRGVREEEGGQKKRRRDRRGRDGEREGRSVIARSRRRSRNSPGY